jgi:hypothetical protein
VTQLVQQDFPQSEQKVQWLVKQHLEIKDEPLLLALYYAPDRDPQDIFVFEVIEHFGADSVAEDRDLFEITYDSTTTFPLEAGQKLHLILTNPQELRVAFQEGWPLAREIRDSVNRGSFRVIHQGPVAPRFMEQIRG